MSPVAVWVAPSLWPLLALSEIRWQKSNESCYQITKRQFQFAIANRCKHEYESPKTELDHSRNLCRRGRHAICGWLRRDGFGKHNILALSGWIPRAHPADT